MVDYGLETEHRTFRHACRRLIEEQLMALANEGETQKQFPRKVLEVLADYDYLGILAPKDYGGADLDLLFGCIFIEELTRASAGVSAGVFVHIHLALSPIIAFGTAEQQRVYIPAAIRAQKIGAFALTEEAAGSDVKGIQTRATEVKGGYRLTGRKLFITNGNIADFILVAAKLQTSDTSDDIALFIVDKPAQGLTTRPLNKLGNWSSDTASISLDDVFVPYSRVLGESVAGGFGRLTETLIKGRILVANRALAIAQQAYELSLQYAKMRTAFGQTIGAFQAISSKIVTMARDLDVARLLIYRAAMLSMAGSPCESEASMAKWFASELAQRTATQALHIYGGNGYMEDLRLAQLYRDAPEAVIGEGTIEIQQRIIAKHLGLK